MFPETDFPIPEEVQSLFDEADDRGPFSAAVLTDRVVLVNRHDKQIVREVLWPQAGEYARRFLDNLARFGQ